MVQSALKNEPFLHPFSSNVNKTNPDIQEFDKNQKYTTQWVKMLMKPCDIWGWVLANKKRDKHGQTSPSHSARLMRLETGHNTKTR